MTEETLRDRIAFAFGYEFSYLLDEGGHDVTQKAADAALAALGLGDLAVAVGRASPLLTGCTGHPRLMTRLVLQTALTTTPERNT